MRTSTSVQETQPTVSVKTAYVLADPQVWTPALASALEKMGMAVVPCAELHHLFEATRSRPASLLVIAQPNAAFTVRACRAMRGLQDVPMLAVIARESELIPVLDAGADDCVLATTAPEVLAARARALLRRVQQPARSGGVITVRDLTLDLDQCRVTLNDRPISLTPTEFRLLAVLAQNAGKVIDASTLLSSVHRHNYSERDAQNLVKVHIANLRRKLGDSQRENSYILCVRGFGYMLERRSRRREGDPLASLVEPPEDGSSHRGIFP